MDREGLHFSILIEDNSTLWIIVTDNFVSFAFKLLNRCCWTVTWSCIICSGQVCNRNRLAGRIVNIRYRCLFLIWGICHRCSVIWGCLAHVVDCIHNALTWCITRDCWTVNCWEVCPINWRPCPISYFPRNIIFRCIPVECQRNRLTWSNFFAVAVNVLDRFCNGMTQV